MTRQHLNCPATETHQRHMETLKGHRSSDQVKAYIADVERSEGKHAAGWLRDDFGVWRMSGTHARIWR